MSVGKAVRNTLGPLERPIAGAYRGAFINIGVFAELIAAWRVSPETSIHFGEYNWDHFRDNLRDNM